MTRDRAFLGACALLFLAGAGVTIEWCRSMAGGMPMPGGWTMSMAWMRMPGQSWLGAAASFMGMWVVMMVAMMMPSLAPMLSSYRRSVRRVHGGRLAGLTALVAAGYLLTWAAVGAAVYPLGVVLGATEMRWPALARLVPVSTGVVLLLAGGVQLTAWKARQLGLCREAPCCRPVRRPDARAAFRHGLHLGAHCSRCCSGLMAVLLVAGVMDLGAMALVAAAITFERLAPRPERAARASGLIVIATGGLVIARALVYSSCRASAGWTWVASQLG
jgi:predicted metal-binding membrane protein